MTVESGRKREMKRVSSLSSTTLVCRGGGRKGEGREKGGIQGEGSREGEGEKEGVQRTDTI